MMTAALSWISHKPGNANPSTLALNLWVPEARQARNSARIGMLEPDQYVGEVMKRPGEKFKIHIEGALV